MRIEGTRFIFYEVNQRNRKYRFGTFCVHCSIELVDELKGKVEWFQMEKSWKGYVHPAARSELEKTGLIHPKRNSQFIEIEQVRKCGEIGRRDALALLRIKYTGGLISEEEYEKLSGELGEANPQ